MGLLCPHIAGAVDKGRLWPDGFRTASLWVVIGLQQKQAKTRRKRITPLITICSAPVSNWLIYVPRMCLNRIRPFPDSSAPLSKFLTSVIPIEAGIHKMLKMDACLRRACPHEGGGRTFSYFGKAWYITQINCLPSPPCLYSNSISPPLTRNNSAENNCEIVVAELCKLLRNHLPMCG